MYLTFGLMVYTPEEEVEATKRYMEKGFRTFKLQGIDDDGREIKPAAERVRRLRETVGEDREIILDGHNNYNIYQAIELAKAVEPYRMAYFDEPLFARDAAAVAALRQAVPGFRSRAAPRRRNAREPRPHRVRRTERHRTERARSGRLAQSVKVPHMAEMYHLPMVTGGASHLQNAHLIAAVTNGSMTRPTAWRQRSPKPCSSTRPDR